MANHENMRDPQMSPPAAKPETPSTSAEPEPNLRQWLARNGPILVPLGALLVYLFIALFRPEKLQ